MIYKIKTFVVKLIIQFLYGFNKWEILGEENITSLVDKNQSFILVTWHGKVLSVFKYFANKNYIGLASKSKDGSLIADVAIKMGYKLVRGSSGKGGSEAYQEMVALLKNPSVRLIITPDGPTGPEHIPKAGAVRLARESGVPIIPVIGHVAKSWKFKNWHTFYVSKPFSKTKLVIGSPLYFNKEQSIDECLGVVKESLMLTDEMASSDA
ncbi:lysophospholipid acyltransferase family protein [Candidatus Marinimicrobia bacterium]|jgi:lysophospholipid acyltransferase (LPLAT)-like uncharacterized protein|nr:lysophospholipid acyltransferase family protein [Candidatus Neomarinimicrobiota bacterium]|tara:strand:+ start:1496 stop:2122 length:627 start_codon:yes stop_codon:yes gene_type:complete